MLGSGAVTTSTSQKYFLIKLFLGCQWEKTTACQKVIFGQRLKKNQRFFQTKVLACIAGQGGGGGQTAHQTKFWTPIKSFWRQQLASEKRP